MKHTIKKTISENEIKFRISQLSYQINEKYCNVNEEILLIALLKSSFIFISDLCRVLEFNHKIDFIITSRYEKKINTNCDVKIIKDLNIDIYGKHVILVEDIIDLGITINTVYKLLLLRKPKSLKICTLLKKKSKSLINIDISYIGFTIPDYFVVGYGMDYAEKYRHLPYISKLILI